MTGETLAERDARLNAWLAGVKPGDIVTVKLNSTDTLTGKVYEAPDDSERTALCVNTTLLRHGNGYPGGSFEPVTPRPVTGEANGLRDQIAAALEADLLDARNGYPAEWLAWFVTHKGGERRTMALFERVQAEGARDALLSAADAIQALHPGEVKNSVLWLRERADNPYRSERAGETP